MMTEQASGVPGVLATSRTALEECLCADEFFGYELSAAKKLHSKLPCGLVSIEDLLAEVRLWALEAVRMFVPGGKAVFTTLLYKHLTIRSMCYFNSAWAQKSWPQGGYVAPFSAFEARAGCSESGERHTWDPTRSTDRAPRVTVEIKEFVRALSPPSRFAFRVIRDWLDDHMIQAFAEGDGPSYVSELTGISRALVEKFVQETHLLAPEFISSLTEAT